MDVPQTATIAAVGDALQRAVVGVLLAGGGRGAMGRIETGEEAGKGE